MKLRALYPLWVFFSFGASPISFGHIMLAMNGTSVFDDFSPAVRAVATTLFRRPALRTAAPYLKSS